MVDLQCANGSEAVQIRHDTSVSNQVVDAPLANNPSRVYSGLLEGGVVGEVCMEDMDIRATAVQFCSHFLLCSGLIADKADDQVLRVF